MEPRRADIVQSKCIPKVVYSTFEKKHWDDYLANQIVFDVALSARNHHEIRRWCSENFVDYFIYIEGRLMCKNHSDMVGAKTYFQGHEFE